ncbi:thiolase-like protein [Aspergillus cavernicola]|uniref:Thiolase-like protein n=1 Tax=Aspergillus cavernicola TaxID=176166 RepID=A0ABR4IDD4_9EURO
MPELLKINANTGIQTRAVIDIWDDPAWTQPDPPSAEEVDAAFRKHGVQLAKDAALKALKDSNISPSSITHMVSVTARNAGLVAREIGISPTAERILLAGVGCAGGLAALGVASNSARGATYRGKDVRILVLRIGPALFSDGAAALVLCNGLALNETIPSRFSVLDHWMGITAGTHDALSYRVTAHGFRLLLSREVPKLAVASLKEPFQALTENDSPTQRFPSDFHWVIHPGGFSILCDAQTALDLPNDALEESYEMYRNRGNPSKDVIACAFGPGRTTEMMLLKRLM